MGGRRQGHANLSFGHGVIISNSLDLSICIAPFVLPNRFRIIVVKGRAGKMLSSVTKSSSELS